MGVLLLAARKATATADRPRARAAATNGRSRPEPSSEIRGLIEREAAAQGVPPQVALAFAELESGFNPRAFGDRDWASRRTKQWNDVRRCMPNNPAIDDPSAWGSYGLFGLLAAYHVQRTEHPQVLWDAALNTRRGVAAVKHALARASGDVRSARLLYVGCGLDGSLCSREHVARVDARLRSALAHWSNAKGVPVTVAGTDVGG